MPWAAFTKHIGIIDRLAAECPVERTSPNAAPVYDVLQSFILTALTDGRCISHIEGLREGQTIPETFGMDRWWATRRCSRSLVTKNARRSGIIGASPAGAASIRCW